MQRIAGDADDFDDIGVLVVEHAAVAVETPADRILSRPEFFRRSLRDDRDLRRALTITLVEMTAFDDVDAHGLEILRADPGALDERRLARLPWVAAFKRHFPVPAELIHRQMAGQPDTQDSGQRRQARRELAIEGRRLVLRLVARAGR